jgi:hypothetical protein
MLSLSHQRPWSRAGDRATIRQPSQEAKQGQRTTNSEKPGACLWQGRAFQENRFIDKKRAFEAFWRARQ